MFESAKRFSGELEWLAPHLPKKTWSFIGCANTEDRCVSGFEIATKTLDIKKALFYEVKDFEDITGDWSSQTIFQKTVNNKNKIKKLYPSTKLEFFQAELLASIEDMEIYFKDSFKFYSSANILFDISSFPKKYFLTFLHWLLEKKTIKNLVVINSQPEKYCEGDLSRDYEKWAAIRPFQDPKTQDPEIFFVGVGFLPLGLPKVRQVKDFKTKFIFPFPPGPPNFAKNWLFLEKIRVEAVRINEEDILFIDAADASAAFNLIRNITDKGAKRSQFAPFGPKPISMAMGLYASYCYRNSDDYQCPTINYCQPRMYNPDYSSGFKKATAYVIKLEGKELYTIDS